MEDQIRKLAKSVGQLRAWALTIDNILEARGTRLRSMQRELEELKYRVKSLESQGGKKRD